MYAWDNLWMCIMQGGMRMQKSYEFENYIYGIINVLMKTKRISMLICTMLSNMICN